jgi:outer membrane protein TolC
MVSLASASETLTFEASRDETQLNNPEIRAARASLDAARQREGAAFSGNLPQLSAGATYNDASGSAVLGSGSVYGTSLSVTQNVFAGFSDRAKVEQARANREGSEMNLAIVRARVSFDLQSAFAGLLYAQQNVALTESIARRLEENVRLVELRYEGGRENKGAYLLTAASAASARLDAFQAKQALRAAQAQFARVLGRDAPATLAAAGTMSLAEPEAAPLFVELVRLTPEYRQAQTQEQAAKADITTAQSGFYPNVNVTGTTAREGNDSTRPNDRHSIGVNLSLPLFSGGRDYYTTQSAAATLVSTQATRDNLERQLRVKLEQAYYVFAEAVERVKVDEAFVQATQTRAEIARARYNNGLMSFDDWDIIEKDLILRQKALLLSRRDRVVAQASWEQAQGKSLFP